MLGVLQKNPVTGPLGASNRILEAQCFVIVQNLRQSIVDPGPIRIICGDSELRVALYEELERLGYQLSPQATANQNRFGSLLVPHYSPNPETVIVPNAWRDTCGRQCAHVYRNLIPVSGIVMLGIANPEADAERVTAKADAIDTHMIAVGFEYLTANDGFIYYIRGK